MVLSRYDFQIFVPAPPRKDTATTTESLLRTSESEKEREREKEIFCRVAAL